MPRIWTDAQRAAIDIRGKNLLVSAAAGSGKTATLTERIIRSITDDEAPLDISRMLIVTFTRAAAAELRQRIFSALSDSLSADPTNKHLSSQLVKLGNAKICTIDSFYLELIRDNFSTLGLPPAFRVADTAEIELLSKEIMSSTINSFYDRDTEKFSLFAEAFSNIRNSARLPDIFLDLYSHISAYPEGIEFLGKCAEECRGSAECDFFYSSFGRILKENTVGQVEHFIKILSNATETILSDEAAEKAYFASFSYDLTFCRDLLEQLTHGSYESARAHILSYSPIKLKSLKAESTSVDTAILKDRRTAVSKAIKALGAKSFGLTAENISEAMSDTASYTEILFELLSEFEKKLYDEKLARGVCDFSDIRRFALKLLVSPDGTPTETAKNLSERYTDIYIDEYQDVDRVQDMIFAAISNGHNRFMVGDIKQSIYGFRGAEPQVFAAYRSSFPTHGSDEADGDRSETVYMSNNFRCDENIIKFTNSVCSYLFGICAENIGYTAEDDLVFSKSVPEEGYISPRVTLGVIVPPDDEESAYVSNAENNKYSEAKYIASKISELLATGKKADGTPIRENDIAVLFRSSSMKEHLCRAFEESGIAYSGVEDAKYFENPDVLLVLSLLNIIDNPHRDIHLAGALRSPLFSFTLDELIELRGMLDPAHSLYETLVLCCEDGKESELREKCRAFMREIEEWRDMTFSMSVDKLIQKIYSSKLFIAAGLCTSENLRILYEYARRFESGAFRGLYNFIEYINKLIREGKKLEGAASGAAEGSVSLMTVHHSKGLEFPVCFICGTSGEFNRSDFKESLLFEYSSGVAMKLPDGTGFARINTPMREAVASKIISSQTEEEMRVLYVALTRARERLYVTGSSRKSREKLLLEAEERAAFADRYTLMKCHSYLEWILTAIANSDLENILDCEFVEADAVELPEPISLSAISEEGDGKDALADESDVEKFRERISYSYPYSALSRLPAKISVSRLSPDVLDESSDTLKLFEADRKAEVPAILLGGREEKISAAKRGTATHLFLQFCNFERAESCGVREELARLIGEKFLPATAENEVFEDELEKFFASELYSEIRSAKKVIREQRFNIYLPPSIFSKDEKFISEISQEMLAVQGVIDLILIDRDGRLRIYDYKTDRVSYAEIKTPELLQKKMRELHSEQLSYYKIAAERLFGMPCSSLQVYSTHAAKTVDID